MSDDRPYHIASDRIKVPLAIVYGHYEKLTDEQLEDHIADLLHEKKRRKTRSSSKAS